MGSTTRGSLRSRLEATFWERHANPWSGGTRILVYPVLMYAIYKRNRRLFAATVAFIAVNPVLFPRPERTDNYLSRIVLAEREWLDEGNGTMSLDYPNVLNVLNIPVTVYAFASAIRRKPVGTVLGTLGVMVLKLWWTDAIVKETGVTGRGPDEEPNSAE
ncbi:hypothetical protein E6P09_09890 [Haloferax mediterranei ATCC 33500]|uniref:Uncharacterized protein n=1 Tax=Haloferax mediterranei (strain ATCC 33500 / DSM 1411 / JCM 8866 / NBRC 14739 / NCIMB 2177 / R-4) TaxID=523841 RepID=I3R4C3_HALMT|nr:DUF6653 family protein [Haloferax mediterranei]AFK19083.1 hypothetical protein HFX_1373 [Haloferax mediterranei ATCC 33500]AHZ21556.1 hypothetical protein BM92_02310 [Haloferax mediterranei ATCC 33500]EMA04018.1 hypothetical protein C439_03633 [Haloferax mediterranei ATCC 33500]MDX5989176.1 DUF6653 family protein [Haloferax mediterranei ATCC 33500]QCQ75557.1 hypothetical protein E6P09_09890 [Haloferax mediterranei ATCC 33500]